ncbi:hypothetical protein DAEQUDRAFT_481021 [Daedalea quercina L-15889]|uniref:Uncharacterized protein n=1 Tax=Daedalea quercina L-15889 TaxID=1314783 RepID=A0A165MTP9_9APHY|nr:hypothetical protein DAEQUDRAFT_481021 [Daedalea quercina L-15889]
MTGALSALTHLLSGHGAEDSVYCVRVRSQAVEPVPPVGMTSAPRWPASSTSLRTRTIIRAIVAYPPHADGTSAAAATERPPRRSVGRGSST